MSTRRPRIGTAPAWSFPSYDEAFLANGLRVWAFHLPGQYVASAVLCLDIPLTVEPRDREGVAGITVSTLDEGTRSHPGSAYTERLEDVGAVFGGGVSLSGTQVGIASTVAALPEALPLLAEAVVEPALADEDVERHVGLRQADLVQVRARAAQLAGVLVPRTVFSPRSRASRPGGGVTKTVQAITPDDVRAFHAAHYSPAGATLVLAGDLTGVDPVALVERAFGGWQGPSDRPTRVAPKPAAPTRRLIGREEAVQAAVRLAAPVVDRLDPRWPALQVATVVLGGSFQSRLNTQLRERRGYTYGVHMSAHPMRGAGYAVVAGSFRTDVVGPALTEARALLDLARRPLTRDEVRLAIRYLTDISPLRYETAAAVAEQAAVLAMHGLDPTYVDLNRRLQREVTPDAATAAYTELWPTDPALLVVGHPSLSDVLGLPAEPVPAL